MRIVLLASWPFAIYYGLTQFEPKHLALLILPLILLRRGFLSKIKVLQMADWSIIAVTIVSAAGVYLVNSERLLRLYPVVVSLGLLILFASSLVRPPTIIERIARTDHPCLSPEGVSYTKRVTQIWCIFFLLNASTAAVTALYASREVWLFYNGFLSYLLIAVIFGGEWIVRRRHLQASGSS